MHQKTLLALALFGSALGHSGVPLVKGDVAGAMTALGINPDVPVSNKNKNVIEKDANTMPSTKNAKANGLGTLNQKTKVTMDMLDKAVTNGGAGTLPQVKDTLDITYRQMVIDGRFDQTRGAAVLIDPTATGNFANSVAAKVVQAPDVVKKATIGGTTVVGQDMPMKVQIPAGVTCSGPQNTCLVRVVNGKNEGNNLWGGHFLFQQAGATTGTAAGTAAGAAKMVKARSLIQTRDGGVAALAEQLKKIAVREEPDANLEKRADDTGDNEPTYADMLAFEAANPVN